MVKSSGLLEVNDSPSIEAMRNCLIRAASVAPASCMPANIRKFLQISLNPAGFLNVAVYQLLSICDCSNLE